VIRNTSQEKDAEKLADEFEKQTDEMWKRFKSKKKADSELRQVLNSAGQLDKLVYSLHMGDRTTTSWEIVRSALQEVANAYGVQVSYLHSNAWQTQ
jgi:trans-2-enoyl-CoA reductase